MLWEYSFIRTENTKWRAQRMTKYVIAPSGLRWLLLPAELLCAGFVQKGKYFPLFFAVLTLSETEAWVAIEIELRAHYKQAHRNKVSENLFERLSVFEQCFRRRLPARFDIARLITKLNNENRAMIQRSVVTDDIFSVWELQQSWSLVSTEIIIDGEPFKKGHPTLNDDADLTAFFRNRECLTYKSSLKIVRK